MMSKLYTFHDGQEFGTREQLLACDKFDAILTDIGEDKELPYLVGSNTAASDLAAGMVSCIALTTAITDRTGGIPSDELAFFANPNVGFTGLLRTVIEDQPSDTWNPLAQYCHSQDILSAATESGATHVYMVNLVMLNMASHDGKKSTNGVCPMLRFVGWDIQRGVGMRWFVRVASTGNDKKPFHLIPWDKPEGSDRHDWRSRVIALGVDTPVEEEKMGAYFMEVLRPGVETLSSFNEHECIVPTPAFVSDMRKRLLKGDFGDVNDMLIEAAEQLGIEYERLEDLTLMMDEAPLSESSGRMQA
jgi:hypothetical protein